MDKPDTEKPKHHQTNAILPACGDIFKSTAIHGAVMGNLTGYKENTPLYFNENKHPV